jgi:hypothetical protein
MAKDPAFLFYYQDFLVGTQFMSNEEVGAYIKVLCHMADKGKLECRWIKMLCGNDEIYRGIIDKFEHNGHGIYRHKRLQEEVEKRRKYSESRRLNRTKPQTKKDIICESYDEHMENENENENVIKNTSSINKGRKKFVKPTVAEIADYCKERKNGINPEAFFAHYEANGWIRGKTPIKDWKACVRTWEQRDNTPKGFEPKDDSEYLKTLKAKADKDCFTCWGKGYEEHPRSGKKIPCKCTEK